jgi:hypothetical protein
MKFGPQSFNDLLALILIAAIVALWILQGQTVLALRDDTNGALVVLFTLVVQYYFRRAPTAATSSPETTTTTVTTDTTTTPAKSDEQPIADSEARLKAALGLRTEPKP